jgi:O-antigen/teichoic acid export membrane protein
MTDAHSAAALGELRPPSPLALVKRAGGVVFAIQVAGAGLLYAQQIVLARALGASGYGTYTYVYVYAGFAALLAGLGLPAASVRFLPVYRAENRPADSSRFVRSALRLTYATALAGAALAVLLALALNRAGALAHPAALLLAALLVPALASSTLDTELARASGRMGLAYLGTLIARPALVALAVVMLAGTRGASPAAALSCTALVAYAVACVQRSRTSRLFAPGPVDLPAGAQTREWLGVGCSLLAVSAFVIVLMQLDIVIVGALRGPHAAGLYAAASRTAALVSFVILAVNAPAAPQFARLWQQRRGEELSRLVAHLAKLIFWPSLGIAASLALLSGPVLALFGTGFQAARGALLILLVGQLINATAGSVGYLLSVTGHHRQAAAALGGCALLFLALTTLGTALAGLDGAAAASAFGFLLWNVALGWLVVRRLRIWPAFLPAPRALRGRACA